VLFRLSPVAYATGNRSVGLRANREHSRKQPGSPAAPGASRSAAHMVETVLSRNRHREKTTLTATGKSYCAMKRLCFLILCAIQLTAAGQSVRTLDQIPDLKSLPDSTAELQQQIDNDGGNLVLGDTPKLRITKPLVIDLAKHGAVAVRASRGVTIVMDGPGPALRLIGTHQGTASPKSFRPATWKERMPLVSGIEILGNHEEADGIELFQTVGAIIRDVSVRWCRHGIHLVNRNRNVVISDCHLYENSGVGIYLDDVNLHQINVANAHISYNRAGGIVVRDGNVRNLQVSGCDLEGNMPADETPTNTANILVDVSGSPEDRSKSIAEIAITGCTIQHAANAGPSTDKFIAPGGANIRLAGKSIYPIDTVTITGNVLSDTTTNIDINHAIDVAISANNFFTPHADNLIVNNSARVVVTGNTFNPRSFVRPGRIIFADCRDCIIANSTLHRLAVRSGALVLRRCRGLVINALSFSDCGSGIALHQTADATISNCRISGTNSNGFDLSIDDSNRDILLLGNAIGGSNDVAIDALDQDQDQ